MPRPAGDTDLTASQVLDGLAAVDAAHRAERRRGRPTEEDYAAALAVSRRTLHAYRRRFGVPAPPHHRRPRVVLLAREKPLASELALDQDCGLRAGVATLDDGKARER